MSGRYNGLQARVQQRVTTATWVPCTVHSLNSVGKYAAECCAETAKFFDFLEKLFIFFTASTCRYQHLSEALGDYDNRFSIKRVTTTRWSCRADSTKALISDYMELCDVLESIIDDHDEKLVVRCEAEGLLNKLKQLETGTFTAFWNVLLQRTNATNKTLQKSKIELKTEVLCF